jgi:hypothetical protein
MTDAVVRKLQTGGFRICIDLILKNATNRIWMQCYVTDVDR